MPNRRTLSDRSRLSTAAAGCAIVLLIAGGLALDRAGGPSGQILVSLLAWGFFGLLFYRESVAMRPVLLACLAFATAGEIILSLVWGLYDYRLGNLPLFVPPGHVLLFWLGLQVSRTLPDSWLRPVPLIASLAVLGAAILGHDTLSLPLLALYLLCWRFGPSPALYSTMFLLALAMELWGTWLGNWAWRPRAPLIAIGAGNPPLAAGAFYCALDLLVLLSTVAFQRAADTVRD